MDVGKGWATRGSCAGGAHDKTLFRNRMMLRFRPIAPKPVADGSVPDSTAAANKAEVLTKRRSKRKYVRVNKNRKCKMSSKEEEEDKRDLNFEGALVSSPSVAGREVLPDVGPSQNMDSQLHPQAVWMNLDNKSENSEESMAVGISDRAGTRVVESWLVVEGMTETWLEVGGLGSTDTEKMRNLEGDTCPGLISDGERRVLWVNLAYRRMVDGDEGKKGPADQVVVWLVVKENIEIPAIWPVFACTVRVVYTWRKEKYSQTMPCDVWKMDFGGFAWRLDSKAALCLGR